MRGMSHVFRHTSFCMSVRRFYIKKYKKTHSSVTIEKKTCIFVKLISKTTQTDGTEFKEHSIAICHRR